MIREFPAYGRSIARLIVAGQKPVAVGVLLGREWDRFAHAPRVCIKPDAWAPGLYEFGWLQGLRAVILWGADASPRQMAELACELMAAHVCDLWVYDTEGRAIAEPGYADELGAWLRATCGEETPAALDAAVAVFSVSRMRFGERAMREIESVRARDGDAAAARWRARFAEVAAQARRIFSTTYQDDEAAHAA